MEPFHNCFQSITWQYYDFPFLEWIIDRISSNRYQSSLKKCRWLLFSWKFQRIIYRNQNLELSSTLISHLEILRQTTFKQFWAKKKQRNHNEWKCIEVSSEKRNYNCTSRKIKVINRTSPSTSMIDCCLKHWRKRGKRSLTRFYCGGRNGF